MGAGRLDPLLVIFLTAGVLGLLVGAAFLTGVALAGSGAFLGGFFAGGAVFLAGATDLFAGAGFLLLLLLWLALDRDTGFARWALQKNASV